MIRLFRVSIPSSVLALVITDAVLVFSCYLAAAYLTVESSVDVFLLEDGGWWRIAVVTGAVILGLYFSDLYEHYRVRSRIALLQQFSLVIGAAFLLQALLSYGRWDVILPKWLMVVGSLMVIVVVPLWRIVFLKLVWTAFGAQKLLFMGSSLAARNVVDAIVERPELGMLVLGYLGPGEASGWTNGLHRLGGLEDLKAVASNQRPDRIVIGLTERRGQLPVHDLLELRLAGVQIEEAAATYEMIFGRIPTAELRPSQMIFSGDLGPRQGMVTLQSIYSWILGLFGLLVALPVMLIVAVLVKLTSRGPVFYRQTRLGRNGMPFVLYKFRSMRQDAEASTGAVWATKDDPRITPLGRTLRKLRLDELPQLLNVIQGHMSLVGPRPERPEFVAVLQEKIPFYRHRLYVKPGLTGWAQINHKYGDTIEDTILKLEYDLYYIKHLAPSLDFYIMFHTVKTVLLGRGAQ